MTTSIDTTTGLLEQVLADLADVIGEIRDEQLADATPCTEFDVAQLRHHVVGWLTTFTKGYADPEGRTDAGIDEYKVSDDPAAEVRSAAKSLGQSLRAGAAERLLYLGDSGMPGDMALDLILWEYLMHGWDLATATGRPWAPPVAAVQASLGFAPGMLTDDYQGEGKPFGPRVAVSADAAPLDQLLGLSGRDPGWTA